jgi:hypothetical protein
MDLITGKLSEAITTITLLTRLDSIVEIEQNHVIDYTGNQPMALGRRNTEIAKPVRPFEFSLWAAVPFVNLFVILAVALGVIHLKASVNGKFPTIDNPPIEVFLIIDTNLR